MNFYFLRSLDSIPLLEALGSTSQVAEKGLRKSIAYLKEHLKLGSVESYGWIEGKNIIEDILTKTGSKRNELDEIMVEVFLNMRRMKRIV